MSKQAGRPEKFDNKFYLLILKEFETLSFTEIAKLHGVSRSTAIRWVRKGKVIANEQG